jgi:copper resistance protein C
MTVQRLTARACALGTLLAGLMLALTATPAWAHTELVAADPAEGATVSAAVSTVTLTFSEPVSQQQTTIDVIGADGTNYSTGSPRSVDAKVSQDVRPLPTGAIRVLWKTVASDGDPVQGEFSFANAFVAPTTNPPTTNPPTTAAPSTAAGTTPAATGSSAAASGDGGGGGALPWILAGLVVVIAVIAGVVYLRRGRSSGPRSGPPSGPSSGPPSGPPPGPSSGPSGPSSGGSAG